MFINLLEDGGYPKVMALVWKIFNLDGNKILFSLHFLSQITREAFQGLQLEEDLTKEVTFPQALEAIFLHHMVLDHQQEEPTLQTLEVTSHQPREEQGLQQVEHILPTQVVTFPQHLEVTFHLPKEEQCLQLEEASHNLLNNISTLLGEIVSCAGFIYMCYL